MTEIEANPGDQGRLTMGTYESRGPHHARTKESGSRRRRQWRRAPAPHWVRVALLVLTVLVSGACGSPSAAPGGSERNGVTEPVSQTDADSSAAGSSPAIAWEWTPPPPANVGAPAVDEGGIVVTYGHQGMVALGLDGALLWEQRRVGLLDAAPTLAGDLVLAATESGVLAVDRSSGGIVWDSVVDERANPPAVVGGNALVSTWDASVMAFNLSDGQVDWSLKLGGPALGPVSVGNGVAVVSWESENSSAAGVLAFDPSTGNEIWSRPLRRGGVSAPLVVQPGSPSPSESASLGTVVVVDAQIAAHGIELATGEVRWSSPLGGAGPSQVAPVLLDTGEVLITHRRGGLALVDPSTGALRWAVTDDDAAVLRGGPAGPTPGGRFVLPLYDGTLMVVRDGLLDDIMDPPGRVTGVAVAGENLLVATRESGANALYALDGL